MVASVALDQLSSGCFSSRFLLPPLASDQLFAILLHMSLFFWLSACVRPAILRELLVVWTLRNLEPGMDTVLTVRLLSTLSDCISFMQSEVSEEKSRSDER